MIKRIRKSTTRINKTSRMKRHQMICSGFSQGEINVRRTGNEGPSGKPMETPIWFCIRKLKGNPRFTWLSSSRL